MSCVPDLLMSLSISMTPSPSGSFDDALTLLPIRNFFVLSCLGSVRWYGGATGA